MIRPFPNPLALSVLDPKIDQTVRWGMVTGSGAAEFETRAQVLRVVHIHGRVDVSQ